MSASINDRTLADLLPDQANGGGDSRLIFGVPYEAGERIVIPVAELLDGADPRDELAGNLGQRLIQERSLGLIEIDGTTADYRPITNSRRTVMIGAMALLLAVIAVLLRSRMRVRR